MRLSSLKQHGGNGKKVLIGLMVLSLALGMFAFPQSSYAAPVGTQELQNAQVQQQSAAQEPQNEQIKNSGKYTLRKMTVTGGEGVQLPAHVYIPTCPQPEEGYPAIVFIHSWLLNQDEYNVKMQEYAAEGYITICYTCRGWYDAPGKNEVAGPLEMEDLTCVVDWLIDNTPVNQDAIGVTGISYGGGQSLLALEFEPRIKTAVPMSSWTNLYESVAPNHSLKVGWTGMLWVSGSTAAKPGTSMSTWLKAFLTDTNVEPALESLAQRSPFTFIDNFNARNPVPPIFIIQGMNDDLFTSRQMIDFYQQYKGPKKIILANGVHASNELPGLMKFSSSVWDETKDWFDYWLKGINNGIMQDDPISIYQTWTKKQATFNSWPVNDDELVLYPFFNTKSSPFAANKQRNGTLSEREVVKKYSTTLKNDPFSLSATSGVFFLSPILQSYLGIKVKGTDPSKMNKGSISFETDVLAEDVTVLGMPHISFQAKPNKDIYQLNFFIYDVDENGTADLVSHLPYTGWRSVPDEVAKVDLDMNILSHKFQEGHCIRLVVTTSDVSYVMPVMKHCNVELFWGGDSNFSLTLPTLDN